MSSNRFAGTDLDAIIGRGGNPQAVAELARLRRVERWARALVDSWQHGTGPDDLRRPGICAELEAAVSALGGGPRPASPEVQR